MTWLIEVSIPFLWFSHVSVRITIKLIFLYNFINYLRPKPSKQVFLLYKTQNEFTGNSKVVDMQRNSKCVLPILLTRSWELKSTFIIIGAFKEAITEIENYWYDDQDRC